MEAWDKDDTFLARWLANELTEEERLAFEASKAFKEYAKIRDGSAELKLPEFDIDAGLQDLISKKNLIKPKANIVSISSFRKWAAAAVILIAAMSSVIYFTMNQDTTLQIQTIAGSIETFQLPDGTDVILNSNSVISYDEETWLESRTLKLNGEAFFKVPSGSPFVVETANGSVTVLGTEFNVKSRSGSFDASCFEGRIAVEVEDVVEELTPGEQIRYSEDTGIESRLFEVITEPRWTTGVIEVRELPLSLAIEELQAVFGIELLNPEILTDELFSGSYPSNNSEVALRLVLEPFGYQFEYDERTKELTLFK
jgi:ferric-dicitrate binding protein FerR (iron transport regulator)